MRFVMKDGRVVRNDLSLIGTKAASEIQEIEGGILMKKARILLFLSLCRGRRSHCQCCFPPGRDERRR